MKRFILALMTVILIMLLSSNTTYSQVPRIINYQASLMDEENKPVNGTVTITFAIFWDEISGVIPLWAENRSVEAVNGFVNIYLGEVVPINLSFDKPYWLEVKLGDAPAYPRTRLSTVPYAYMALRTQKADTSRVAELVVDNGVKQNMLDPNVKALPWGPAGGYLGGTYPNPTINIDSLNKLVTLGFVKLNQNAGGALSGQYPNPSIRDTAVTASKIRSSAVTTVKIADTAVTQRKIALDAVNVDNIDARNHIGGPFAPVASAIMWDGTTIYWGYPSPGGGAGGDLSGYYPSPQVTGLRGVPITSFPSPSDNEVYVFRSYGTPSTLDDKFVPQKILPDNLWSYNNTPLGAGEDNYLLSWDWNGGADPRMRWIPPVFTTTTALPIVGDGSPGNPITLNRAGVLAYQLYYMNPAGTAWINGKLIPQNLVATPSSPGAGEDGYVLSWNNSNTMMQWSGVTSAMIVDGSIVDADVNSAAAIAGTKINPDFGSQNIVTLGNISAASGSFTGILGSSSATITGDMLGIGTTTPNNDIQVVDLINFDDAYQGTFLGKQAGNVNAGTNNTFIGFHSGQNNSNGNANTGIGTISLQNNTNGSDNTAVGMQSLWYNISGNNNAAFGYQSLASNTFGSNNAAFGMFSLVFNEVGNNNTALGEAAGFNSTGSGNVFIGYQAGYNETGNNKLYIANSSANPPLIYGDFSTARIGIGTTTPNNSIQVQELINFDNSIQSTYLGYQAGNVNTMDGNTFVGYMAGLNNTSGQGMTALGTNALNANTTGTNNTAIGYTSLINNTTGNNNTAIGHIALGTNTTGSGNTATGTYALNSNSTGNDNSAYGYQALLSNTGDGNVAIGSNVLLSNTTGNNNTATGSYSLNSSTTANNNTAFGFQTLVLTTTGGDNVAVGYNTLLNNTSGTFNVAVGSESGYSSSTGSGNVFLGSRAGYNETGSNKLYIANSSANPPLIYGDFSTGAVALGTTTPSAGSVLTVSGLSDFSANSTSFTINVANSGSGAGIKVDNGTGTGSAIAIANGGGDLKLSHIATVVADSYTIPDDVSTVLITSDANGTNETITMPAGVDGKILFVFFIAPATADRIVINGYTSSSVVSTGFTFLYAGGAWRTVGMVEN